MVRSHTLQDHAVADNDFRRMKHVIKRDAQEEVVGRPARLVAEAFHAVFQAGFVQQLLKAVRPRRRIEVPDQQYGMFLLMNKAGHSGKLDVPLPGTFCADGRQGMGSDDGNHPLREIRLGNDRRHAGLADLHHLAMFERIFAQQHDAEAAFLRLGNTVGIGRVQHIQFVRPFRRHLCEQQNIRPGLLDRPEHLF